MARCKVLVSACLLGVPVRYDGGAFCPAALLSRWHAEGRVISLCPEVAGGLSTPRPAAEIAADGVTLLTREGQDVSQAFYRGAQQAATLVNEHGIQLAVLKAKSPSCGNRQIYDGSFSGTLIDGQGVTAALLSTLGVRVFNETELAEAAAFLQRLEA